MPFIQGLTNHGSGLNNMTLYHSLYAFDLTQHIGRKCIAQVNRCHVIELI